MVMLVSLQQASDHLRRDTGDDDNDLILKVQAASGAVINYLKDGATFLETAVELDANGEPIGIPFEVKAAVLLMVGYLYKERDGDDGKSYEMGYLPRPVMSLLYPLRKPALE